MKHKHGFLVIAFAATLLFTSTCCFSAGLGKTKASLAGEGFIFTFWPIGIDYCTQEKMQNPDDVIAKNMKAIDDMMGTGMNYAGITFRPNTTFEPCLSQLKSKYKIALEISAGHNNSTTGLTELADFEWPDKYLNTEKGKQFLKAPCLIRPDKCIALGCTVSEGKCQNCPITEDIANNWSDYVDKERCQNWNIINAADPSYIGLLWQNTLANVRNIVTKAMPDIVLYDTEIWMDPGANGVESFFNGYREPGEDCKCEVVKDGIGYDKYNEEWRKRGLELKNAVKEINPSIGVSFYHELPEGGKACWSTYCKTCWSTYRETCYLISPGVIFPGTGDYHSPSIYVLPDLETLEINFETMDFPNALPWLSFTHWNGYRWGEWGSDIYFDPSVSREAGRMLRKAGAKGFVIWPNAYNMKDEFGGKGYNYWLDHATEMVTGFNEGLTYIEKNKIRNPDFEAFTFYADAGQDQGYDHWLNLSFQPSYWEWSDSGANYKIHPEYADLTADKQSGTYAWRHTRAGDIGSRSIYSKNFSIESNETGNYALSIWTKTSVNSSNGKIKFYLANTGNSTEEQIGETGFENNWKKFEKNIAIGTGNYKIKIFLEDNTGQKADILLDNVSLTKTTCGNTICDAGETFETCPTDCPQIEECVDTPKLMNQYIPQWKRGEITMLTLMQKMKRWNRAGCPI